MHTLSSASRTCMASSSAVECTATDGMPSSLQARNTRNAISPRFAIRILSNIAAALFRSRTHRTRRKNPAALARASKKRVLASLDDHQRLAELDRLPVLDQDLDDGPRARRRNLIHGFHRLDDQDRVTSTHAAADLDEGTRTRPGTHIGGPDHRRGDDARVLGKIDSFS